MIRLEDLALFVRTTAHGSFSGAAREMNLLPAQVSAAIKRLERELDIRLFARSTRSLRLTAEGEQYLPYARKMLDTLHEAQQCLQREKTELQGTLQIAAPSDFGRNLLLPWLSDLRRNHPQLSLRVLLSDQIADVFRAPVDAAIRYGRIADASFIALPLAPDNQRVLVAAPAYLEHHGQPATLTALAQHRCLLFQIRGRVHDRWVFQENGTQRQVVVSGSMISDDAEVVRRWALAGEGIAYKSWLDVSQDVREGRLQVLLEQCGGEPAPLQLVCPHRQQFSPAIQQLYALVKARCAQLTRNP
ncbi:LysR family transcriptional regulator [Azomonas macrocytogenes]|uniref:DNA-binding transcriptional LysR family regulator n=1 Tax=Azomonas macrocytogenes TaxID=69962 RepID=A0A839T6U7_AZOMA|nr:LysR family transcriptional regulator [Azomonas macrocytogenes]MBB3103403.1 DNA-binding transcriptional LysR family regulator [Azomonas macrocytogenes]